MNGQCQNPVIKRQKAVADARVELHAVCKSGFTSQSQLAFSYNDQNKKWKRHKDTMQKNKESPESSQMTLMTFPTPNVL